jgi:hypothetical protein
MASATCLWTPSTAWETEIRPLLPSTYQQQARRFGAWTRTRGIPSIDALLHALLCYVFCLRSLRQLGAWATLVGLGAISDRAWSQRVRQSTEWALWLLSDLLLCHEPVTPIASSVGIRVIDASLVRIRSHRGRCVRMHWSYDLLAQRLEQVTITDDHQAEGIEHFALLPQQIILADRAYWRRTTLAAIHAAQAHLLVRWHSVNLPLRLTDGTRFDVAAWLATLTSDQAEQHVVAHQQSLRFLAVRLSPEAAKREAYRRRRKAAKGGVVLQPQTLRYAQWLLLVTTLPAEQWSATAIDALYRARWRIEVLFKQLVRLHQLPSVVYRANAAIVALLFVGWVLLDRWEQRMVPPQIMRSPWQCRHLGLLALCRMLAGTWSWETIAQQEDRLHRYVRASRARARVWSDEGIRFLLGSGQEPA